MHDAATKLLGRSADAIDGTNDIFHQLIHVIGAAVSQFSLGQRPDPFVGVEFGSIGRKVLQMEARVPTQEFP